MKKILLLLCLGMTLLLSSCGKSKQDKFNDFIADTFYATTNEEGKTFKELGYEIIHIKINDCSYVSYTVNVYYVNKDNKTDFEIYEIFFDDITKALNN